MLQFCNLYEFCNFSEREDRCTDKEVDIALTYNKIALTMKEMY